MTTRSSKWSALIAALLAAGLVLAGCSGGDDSAGTGGDTSQVGEDAGTELTEENFFTEVAEAQREAGTSHVEMEVGLAGQSMTAEGDVAVGETPAESAMQMTMQMGAEGVGNVEMRLVDEVFYMNFGPATQNKFATIDLTDESNPLVGQLGGVLDNVDPARQIEQFEQAVTGFEQKGEAIELDGVEAQPYVVTLDGSKVGAAAGLEGDAGSSMPEELTYTMYVGPDNLPRRIVTDVAGTSMQMDYSQWGEDVEIEAPPADQVTDQDPFSQSGTA